MGEDAIMGNQAGLRFAESCPQRLPSPGLCPFGGICHAFPAVQAKLKISQPGDQFEQEADRVAEAVVSSTHVGDSSPVAVSGRAPGGLVQRDCPACPGVGPPQARACEGPACPEEEEVEALAPVTVAPQAVPGETPRLSPGAAQNILKGRQGGQALAAPLRHFFEPRFGRDLSRVRLHTDGQAAAAAQSVRARAFTLGRHIFFGPSEFAPETAGGKKLLAHELAHAIQQRQADPAGDQAPGLVQRTIGDGHDLTSPRFQGDPELEAAYDDERYIRRGDSGPAVEKLQHALIDAGCLLRVFSVDGEFGWETHNAVVKFQREAGIGIDGIVGPETMERLDIRFPPVVPPVFPTGDWTVGCILRAMCLWNRPLVNQLRRTRVNRLARTYSQVDCFDGSGWVQAEEDWGGVSYGDAPVIGLLANEPCATAVDIVYHEIWHQNQPPAMPYCEKERGAYRFTAQWSAYLGLPGHGGHLRVDPATGRMVVDMAGVEATVQEYPGCRQGETIEGKTAQGCTRVRKEGGRQCVRQPRCGDSYELSYHEVLASPPTVPRASWVCP